MRLLLDGAEKLRVLHLLSLAFKSGKEAHGIQYVEIDGKNKFSLDGAERSKISGETDLTNVNVVLEIAHYRACRY